MVRFLNEDDLAGAVQDAAYDRFLETAVRCGECGTRYDQGHHPATRQPGASARSAPTAGQQRSGSHEMAHLHRHSGSDQPPVTDAEISQEPAFRDAAIHKHREEQAHAQP